jgi:hypothetical protein
MSYRLSFVGYRSPLIRQPVVVPPVITLDLEATEATFGPFAWGSFVATGTAPTLSTDHLVLSADTEIRQNDFDLHTSPFTIIVACRVSLLGLFEIRNGGITFTCDPTTVVLVGSGAPIIDTNAIDTVAVVAYGYDGTNMFLKRDGGTLLTAASDAPTPGHTTMGGGTGNLFHIRRYSSWIGETLADADISEFLALYGD